MTFFSLTVGDCGAVAAVYIHNEYENKAYHDFGFVFMPNCYSIFLRSFDFIFIFGRKKKQWPRSFNCVPQHNCTNQYPPGVDFGIHSLWPMRNDRTYPKVCNPKNALKIKNLSMHRISSFSMFLNCLLWGFFFFSFNE